MTRQTKSDLEDALDLVALRRIITNRMRRYPHSTPHPETVEMFARGLLAAIDVSNARPEAYKDEPWLTQNAECHAEHADAHANNAWRHLGLGNNNPWLADDGTPELAHAVVRGMMGLWQYDKEQKK